VRKTERKTLRNKMLKSSLKTYIKKYEAAVGSGDAKAAQETYKVAVRKLDQAVCKGIIHKNKAARKKSQFTNKLNARA